MNIVSKIKLSVKETRQLDDTKAAIEKLGANQDYIAMMSDIELEEEEVTE